MTKTKTYDYSALADALISTGAVSDLATDDNGWKRLALMLADLGESARPIFDKISASASNYDAKQTSGIFTWALGRYDPSKSTVGSFIYLCKDAGIDISEYITSDTNALRPSSKDIYSGTKGKYRKQRPQYKPMPLPKENTLYSVPTAWITSAMPATYEASPLARYLARKFGWEKVNAAFRLYYVGLTRKPVHLEGMHYLPVGSCIFPQVDEKGIVRTAQMMGFDDEKGHFGHRTKYIGSRQAALTWLHSVMMMRLLKATNSQWGWDDNRKRKPYNCISGAHLLNEKAYPALKDKTVAIVESMSTALCMTCAMPEYVWLATAGSSGIKLLADAVLRDAPTLSERNIIVFPDEGKTDVWEKAVYSLGLHNVTVNHFMDSQDIHGGDIKDVVMSADGTFDDIPPEPRKEIITPEVALRHLEEQHPILTELVDKLGLVPTVDDCPF